VWTYIQYTTRTTHYPHIPEWLVLDVQASLAEFRVDLGTQSVSVCEREKRKVNIVLHIYSSRTNRHILKNRIHMHMHTRMHTYLEFDMLRVKMADISALARDTPV
jgi:hypothetical protein